MSYGTEANIIVSLCINVDWMPLTFFLKERYIFGDSDLPDYQINELLTNN